LKPSARCAGTHQRLRVAIFEDDTDLVREMCDALLRANFDTLPVNSTAELRDCLYGGTADILLCDLRSPVANPIDEMSLAPSPVPVVLASGLGNRMLDASKEALSRLGVNVVGVLKKPYGAAEVIALLRRALPPGESTFQHDTESSPIRFEKMAEGLRSDEFLPFMQPIVRSHDLIAVGHEILARWQSPMGGLLMPQSFLPLLQAPRERRCLGLTLLRQSLAAISAFEPTRSLTLSLNVTGSDCADEDFVEGIVSSCREFGYDLRLLTVEISEQEALTASTAELRGMIRLSLLGCSLSVDDFGAGETRLHNLLHLPISEVKIDRSILRRSLDGEPSLLEALCSLGSSLGLRSVVEGIETADELAAARAAGADLLQGFLLGRPRSLAELTSAGAPAAS